MGVSADRTRRNEKCIHNAIFFFEKVNEIAALGRLRCSLEDDIKADL